MIRITCETKDHLSLDKIEDLQKGLKKRSSEDIKLIIKSIEKYGFSFPFFIWKHDGHNYCLDGHGRRLALKEIEKGGEEVPELPVVYIDAKDEEEAKQKLLRLNSQYGKMNNESVREFVGDIEIDWDEIQLSKGSYLEFDDILNSKYTKKITAPIYIPTGRKVDLSECVDLKKTNALIKEIKESAVSEAEKEFLILSAYRHAVFNYRNIAEVYSNASPEMQSLMEKSALIIIDFNKAIEYGYVQLNDEIAEQYLEDMENV